MMGSRASYVLVENGIISVYYSHWGGMSVPSVVFGGPAETSAYIRGLKSATGLLDTTWAEGGILLDADIRRLIFWGGNALNSRPYLRRLFVPVVRLIWEGWSVSWAARGIVEFAEYPGVAKALDLDPASVVDTMVSSMWQPYSEAEIRTPHENPWISAVVTVKWGDGRVGDYTFDRFPHGYLTFGSGLLDLLREREPDPLPRENGDGKNIPIGGAYADVPARTLSVWDVETTNPGYWAQIAQEWPGWQVEEQFEGLAQQIARSGRDPALVTLPLAEINAELIKEVAGDGAGFDPLEFARTTLEHTDPATTTFAPGFFQMDMPSTSATQRRELLIRQVTQGRTGEL
jgi:hypothetical protein